MKEEQKRFKVEDIKEYKKMSKKHEINAVIHGFSAGFNALFFLVNSLFLSQPVIDLDSLLLKESVYGGGAIFSFVVLIYSIKSKIKLDKEIQKVDNEFEYNSNKNQRGVNRWILI